MNSVQKKKRDFENTFDDRNGKLSSLDWNENAANRCDKSGKEKLNKLKLEHFKHFYNLDTRMANPFLYHYVIKMG